MSVYRDKRDKEREAVFILEDNRHSGGQLLETKARRCAHCPTYVQLNPLRQRPRNYCRNCDQYVCDNPICNFECKPYEKHIEEILAAAMNGRPIPAPGPGRGR